MPRPTFLAERRGDRIASPREPCNASRSTTGMRLLPPRLIRAPAGRVLIRSKKPHGVAPPSHANHSLRSEGRERARANRCELLFHLDDFSSHVVTTVRTDHVRRGRRAALRTILQLLRLNRVVGAAAAGAGVRLFSFGYGHGVTYLCLSRNTSGRFNLRRPSFGRNAAAGGI